MDGNDDAALFTSVVSGNASAEEQVSEPVAEPQQEAQPRDESGKFATKAQSEPEAQPAAAAQSQEREPAIPPHRLREEAEARRAEKERADRLESEVAQMRQFLLQQRAPTQQAPQQPQEPPDIFTDPEAWFKHKRDQEIAPVLQQIQAARLEDARAVASVVFGDETVKAAEQAFNELAKRGGVDPVEYERIKSSANPFRAAVEWHKRNSILSEIGNDPTAYREKIKAEILAELNAGATAQQQQTPANVVKIPASLNRATSAAPGNQGGGQVLGDRELFNAVTARRR